MAYNGYLLKVGNYIIPTDKYIKADDYSVLWSGQDIDSYRDADGQLQRTALEHRLGKIEFNTPPMLTDLDIEELMSNISSQYINETEKSCNVEFYNPETFSYITQKMYVPDITFPIYGNYGGRIHYNSIRFAFIAY